MFLLFYQNGKSVFCFLVDTKGVSVYLKVDMLHLNPGDF